MARWKKHLKEIAGLAMVTILLSTVIGYLRAPSYENAKLPEVRVSHLHGYGYDSSEKPKSAYILHFWATWCPTCRAEAGNIESVSHSAKVVSVAVKSGGLDQIEAFKRENGLTYPVINDQNGAIAGVFNISVFPTTIIVDRNNRVFWSETGYTTTWGLKLRLWLAGML